MDRVYLPGRSARTTSPSSAPATRSANASAPRSRGPAPCSPRPGRPSAPCAREMRTAMRVAGAIYERVLDRVERIGFDVLGAAPRSAAGARERGDRRRARDMTRRATARGDERTSLDGDEADVLVCGASFAGLAVARELAGSGARRAARPLRGRRARDERVRRADALAARDGGRRRDPQRAALHALHDPARQRPLPPAVELVGLRLPRAVPPAAGPDATPASRPRSSAAGRTAASRPTAASCAPRSWSTHWAGAASSTPGASSSRPTRRSRAGWRCTRTTPWTPTSSTSGSSATSSAAATAGRVPAGEEVRVGVGSYEPRQHVKEPPCTSPSAKATPCATRATGSRTACAPATEDGVFFVGDSAGHCFPLSGEGIRTAFYFGIACGRELRAVARRARATRDEALERYGAFTRATRRPSAARSRCSGSSRRCRRGC